ncbi:Uncharacterised protein [Mycobacteroides abscessus subsp. abscessus]|uniref:Uncharacterized protein n=3 Tax=Mycobacteroides abscessus TaxID=36809 RepID=A0A829QHR3_9MYCO|nr:hypothetical protein MA6G0125S_3802 [Mycobacteroides abscessus 6G-0125-S]EIU39002.1 hypothetical protein MA6G0125R_2759 [Mycobacteroides abscessus 6G-0125-R]EIU53263.1 hypothetical protein MA6G0728S_3486 [Mycobacteroides abscessus 6G-0728-S]EIU55386.1 hypothetical protein MA6G1108_3727 [Mycobacteroides abscessus 6G-1108]EIU88829.1 hypothetical protein MA6G0212_3788 [Mycobacteroides abscessus 6G-0212]EIU94919.1 hypothetical protein MA6G0728R_3730 [Mycobacteroides abscessus 6G-0728-R]EIV2274
MSFLGLGFVSRRRRPGFDQVFEWIRMEWPETNDVGTKPGNTSCIGMQEEQ